MLTKGELLGIAELMVGLELCSDAFSPASRAGYLRAWSDLLYKLELEPPAHLQRVLDAPEEML